MHVENNFQSGISPTSKWKEEFQLGIKKLIYSPPKNDFSPCMSMQFGKTPERVISNIYIQFYSNKPFFTFSSHFKIFERLAENRDFLISFGAPFYLLLISTLEGRKPSSNCWCRLDIFFRKNSEKSQSDWCERDENFSFLKINVTLLGITDMTFPHKGH